MSASWHEYGVWGSTPWPVDSPGEVGSARAALTPVAPGRGQGAAKSLTAHGGSLTCATVEDEPRMGLRMEVAATSAT
ncbi:hypothetical protein GCM10010174_65920 [Kutzneria viridogrisea]